MMFKEKICLFCGTPFSPTGPAAKFCAACQEKAKRDYNERYHKTHYKRRGYNQRGTSNNNWKSGIGAFRNMDLPKICNRCGSDKFLCVHHKDRNRYNNVLDNLERLCKKCHQVEHGCLDVLPKDRSQLSENRKKFLQENPPKIVRDEQGRFKRVYYKV